MLKGTTVWRSACGGPPRGPQTIPRDGAQPDGVTPSWLVSDYALRQHAQRLLADGQLPRTPPQRSSVSFGTEHRCALCGEMTRPSEPMIELGFDTKTGGITYFFHRACRALWAIERLRSS